VTHTSHVPTAPKTIPPSGSASNQDTSEEHEQMQNSSWGKVMSHLYPLIKMMQIQVQKYVCVCVHVCVHAVLLLGCIFVGLQQYFKVWNKI